MDESFRARPFRFDRVFSPTPPSAGSLVEGDLAAAALYAELQATREEQARLLAQAKAEGREEALVHARAERDQAVLAAIDAIHAAWDDFADMRTAMIDQLAAEAGNLARAIGEQLAGQAIASTPSEAIDAAIGRALQHVARGQEIVIFVHPEYVADIEARVTARQNNDRRHLALAVAGDPLIPPGDAHLRWEGGGLRLDAQARRADVLAELAALDRR